VKADKPGWRELPEGGLLVVPGSSEEYATGDWRTRRPVIDMDKCTQCLLCWVYCPDSSIVTADGKIVDVDLEHCKGCGICARECPPKVSAISMVPEE
jgi:pyruvate ferredoxin oxidoreductase delta subunit